MLIALMPARTADVADVGRVVLAATPLGDPRDASAHLRELLTEADVIAAEDTRRFRRLASDLEVIFTAKLVSFYESVEQSKVAGLIESARAGALVVVVSDAGMPIVSDPGYRLVQACIDAEIPLTVAPGPSAVTTALALSGLPSDRFCFEGFLPRKTGERDRRLWSLVAEQRTMVFFEAPHRITETLAAMERAFGANRRAAVCRELTKTYEQVTRSGLADLVQWSREGVRGEISIVVEGADSNPAEVSDADLVEAVADLMAAGLDKRTATAQVAVTTGQQKRRVYNAVLAAKPTP